MNRFSSVYRFLLMDLKDNYSGLSVGLQCCIHADEKMFSTPLFNTLSTVHICIDMEMCGGQTDYVRNIFFVYSTIIII